VAAAAWEVVVAVVETEDDVDDVDDVDEFEVEEFAAVGTTNS